MRKWPAPRSRGSSLFLVVQLGRLRERLRRRPSRSGAVVSSFAEDRLQAGRASSRRSAALDQRRPPTCGGPGGRLCPRAVTRHACFGLLDHCPSAWEGVAAAQAATPAPSTQGQRRGTACNVCRTARAASAQPLLQSRRSIRAMLGGPMRASGRKRSHASVPIGPNRHDRNVAEAGINAQLLGRLDPVNCARPAVSLARDKSRRAAGISARLPLPVDSERLAGESATNCSTKAGARATLSRSRESGRSPLALGSTQRTPTRQLMGSHFAPTLLSRTLRLPLRQDHALTFREAWLAKGGDEIAALAMFCAP